MNESHFGRNVLLFFVGLVVVGFITIELFHLIFYLLWPLIVGALVIGGGYYLFKRAERSVTSGRPRRRLRG